MQSRLKVEYKVRKFENGKEIERKYIKKFTEAFPLQSTRSGIKA